jgi:tetratricopeptide (TPR) repeat protein
MKSILVLYYTFFSVAILAQSNTADQLIKNGEAALENRQYAEAIKWFAKASDVQPNISKIYTLMMKSAIYKRDLMVYKRCITKLEQLNHPQSANIYITYVQLAIKQRLYDEGMNMLDRAEQFHNNHKAIFMHRATIHERKLDTIAALQVLHQVAVQYPSSKDIQHRLAKNYLNKDTEKSIYYFNKLLKESLYKDAALTSLALLYTRKYKSNPTKNKASLDEALKYYNLYLDRHPKDQNTLKAIQSIVDLQN